MNQPRKPAGLAPETRNAEQDDSGAQAQEVAAEAQRADAQRPGGTESRKVAPAGTAVAPADEPDLVDEMRRMESEGRIDNAAFAGEPNHDDEAGRYGPDTVDNDNDAPIIAEGEPPADEEE